ncbi:MAG: hypothetical protein WCE64_08225 [Bacteroidales bacterium]
MKKLFLTTACLIAAVLVNAQSLDEIIKNYTAANKLDKISQFKTIKISATTSAMGMDMPVEIWMKSPNMIKTVTTVNGQQIVQVFDGKKGYMLNPMTGSTEPVEMSSEQINSILNNNMFQNYMENYLKAGKLTLVGEDVVNGKPAFKIKANIEGGNTAYMYIDKSSYLLVKTMTEVNQGGTPVTVESYPSDYKDINGIFVPMKTTSSAGGMEFVTTFTKVEVDVPMDDSIFKVN